MPKKYHISTSPAPPRYPRIGKFGIIDWREDCAGCHNCVKRACIYDRHRQEMDYIRNLDEVNALFFDCMGCFSCVQNCTKNLLGMTMNPAYESLGNSYWTPDIIRKTWIQAETGQVPVSGAGYGGPFTGPGFDSMWTDMSEIVRPTRDGIHGREYISTSVDIGRKFSYLSFDNGSLINTPPNLVNLPFPLLLDISPQEFSVPLIDSFKAETAARTGIISIVDSRQSEWIMGNKKWLNNLAFYISPDGPIPPKDVLRGTRLLELPDGEDIINRVKAFKDEFPELVIVVRLPLNSQSIERVNELAIKEIEAVHLRADINGNEFGAKNPRFIKDMLRMIHTSLVDRGVRDEITIIAGGGIAMAEHLAKAIICGADLVSIDLPLLIALECQLCNNCQWDSRCPVKIGKIEFEYAVNRMTNLIGAWYGQLIEVMGAMGIREVRRLRGDTGRALFFEDLEEEIFGKLFGRKNES